ncbi:unnamed protein product [Symbiodinium microadriaticum]|nr:unnamed protein product [Symbiodinium microadriaticum]
MPTNSSAVRRWEAFTSFMDSEGVVILKSFLAGKQHPGTFTKGRLRQTKVFAFEAFEGFKAFKVVALRWKPCRPSFPLEAFLPSFSPPKPSKSFDLTLRAFVLTFQAFEAFLPSASTESTPDQSRACDFYHTRSGSGKFLKKHLAWLRTSIFDALLGGRLVRLQESACPNVYGLPTGALARFLVELMLTRYGLRISTVQSV